MFVLLFFRWQHTTQIHDLDPNWMHKYISLYQLLPMWNCTRESRHLKNVIVTVMTEYLHI